MMKISMKKVLENCCLAWVIIEPNGQHKAYQIPEPNSIQSLIASRINFLVGRLTFFSQTRRRAAYHYIKKKNPYKTHTNTLTLSDSYAHDTPHNTTMARRTKNTFKSSHDTRQLGKQCP